MAKKNAYTVVTGRPLSAARSAAMIRFLTERAAKQRGLAVEGTVRERRPGETGLIQDARRRGGVYGT